MGGSISSSISVAITYCACHSIRSLCSACLGQSSSSSNGSSSSSRSSTGRKCSVLLFILSIILALLFQYMLAPIILGNEIDEDGPTRSYNNDDEGGGGGGWKFDTFRTIMRFHNAPVGKYVYNRWTMGCDAYLLDASSSSTNTTAAADTDASSHTSSSYYAYTQCVGNAGVYRPTFFSFLFFSLASIASRIHPIMNRKAWSAKLGLYLLLVFTSIFLPNQPWFLTLFLPTARVGAMIFIIAQQIILIDLAYNWNDTWVGKADMADRIEWGRGAFWLRATISVAISFYILSIMGIGFLYHYFRGCGVNVALITITLLGIVIVTAIQLSGLEGSLLTSSILSLYAVYLVYSAVSKNPHGVCNPLLSSERENPIDRILGLFLTGISLAWTGWSITADDRLRNVEGVKRARSVNTTIGQHPAFFRRGEDPFLDLDQPFLEYYDEFQPSPPPPPPMGLALSSDGNIDEDSVSSLHNHSLKEVWKLNAILALVSCWVAMSLTGWGFISNGIENQNSSNNAANPQVGKLNMVMIAVSQWLALTLYGWTLVAPRLFPNRDFSS